MDSILLGYPVSTYVWIIGLSSISGTVKYLNEYTRVDTHRSNELLCLLRDILTGILSGLMAFWLCESFSIREPLNAVVVTIAGIMGNRAWAEFETLFRTILFKSPIPAVHASVEQQQQIVAQKESQLQQVSSNIDNSSK